MSISWAIDLIYWESTVMDIAFSPFYLNAFNINTANYKYNQMASSHLEISIVCNTLGIKVSTSQL